MLDWVDGDFVAVYRLGNPLSTLLAPRPAPGGGGEVSASPPRLDRPLVLIGLMGAGKTSVGRRLANHLGVPFVDADGEIEAAAGCSIADIFAHHGEAAFRDGERRVIARLLDGAPKVLATGGGAFLDTETRARIAEGGVSVWLRADLDTLVERCARRNNRPLLKTGDPRAILARLMAERHPLYAEAEIVIETGGGPHEGVVERIVDALDTRAKARLPAEPTAPERVRVDLDARGYDIVVGEDLLAPASDWLRPVATGDRVALVSDETVARRHLAPLRDGLAAAGFDCHAVIVPPGEASKSWTQLERLLDALLDARVARDDSVIALGGGVVGDLAGFAAAILRRGVAVIQVPTTLLAQVDSAVGGKTGIDTRQGKNLVGAFHQPRLVLADIATLATLPARELRAGYAEVVKYALIDQPALFDWLEKNGAALLAGDRAARRHAVIASCAAKARIVAADEREGGVRALLNLGHTFAHALEVEVGFGDRLRHGEAVAIGLVLAFDLSARMGLCPAADVARLRRHLADLGLPISPATLVAPGSGARLVAHMAQDKKVAGDRITFVLARGIGHAFLSREVDLDLVRALLDEALGGATPIGHSA